jgi:hypothetical protein
MVTAMAAVLLGALAPASTDVATSDLAGFFVAACLDGEAKLPSATQSVPFDALPDDLRHRLGKPSAAKVWQLATSGHTYLYLLDYESTSAAAPRICGLASDDGIDSGAAIDTFEKRVTGELLPRTTRSVEWLNLESGYKAFATTAGNFNVFQINWLTDADRRKLAKAYRTFGP